MKMRDHIQKRTDYLVEKEAEKREPKDEDKRRLVHFQGGFFVISWGSSFVEKASLLEVVCFSNQSFTIISKR